MNEFCMNVVLFLMTRDEAVMMVMGACFILGMLALALMKGGKR